MWLDYPIIMGDVVSKVCLIRQPAGLGDILFCQKIADHFRSIGYDIIWPVIKEFHWLRNYIKKIDFPLTTDNFFGKQFFLSKQLISTSDFMFLPLQDADQIVPSMLIMDSKYRVVGLTHEDWQKFLIIERNPQKESKLYTKLNPMNEPYIFVNKNYGSPPGFKTIGHIPAFNKKVIEMTFDACFSLFDWIKILENAEEIHTVDTCLSYIIEVLPSIQGSLYLYSRYEPKSFYQTKHLYTRNWSYII